MRFSKYLAALLLGSYLLYLTAVFTLLSTTLLERLIDLNPHTAQVTIQRGWSWIPGVVEIRDANIEVQDQNMHLYVTIPAAKARVSLFGLISRRLEISELESEPGIISRIELRTPAEKRKYIAEEKPELEPSDPWELLIRGIVLREIAHLQVGKW